MSEIKKTQIEKLIRKKAESLYIKRCEDLSNLIHKETSKFFHGYHGTRTDTYSAFEKEYKEKKEACIAHIEKELSDELLEKMGSLKYFFEANQ